MQLPMQRPPADAACCKVHHRLASRAHHVVALQRTGMQAQPVHVPQCCAWVQRAVDAAIGAVGSGGCVVRHSEPCKPCRCMSSFWSVQARPVLETRCRAWHGGSWICSSLAAGPVRATAGTHRTLCLHIFHCCCCAGCWLLRVINCGSITVACLGAASWGCSSRSCLQGCSQSQTWYTPATLAVACHATGSQPQPVDAPQCCDWVRCEHALQQRGLPVQVATQLHMLQGCAHPI